MLVRLNDPHGATTSTQAPTLPIAAERPQRRGGEAPMQVEWGEDGVLRPSWANRSEVTRHYFDTEWNRPVRTERGLFELLVLLVFAGGLSWSIVLDRRAALREAWADFDPEVVAAFTDRDVERLLADARIIRNRSKIEACIRNARAVCSLRSCGGLPALVWNSDGNENNCTPVELVTLTRSDGRSERLSADFTNAGFVRVGPVAAQSLQLAAGVRPVRRADPLRSEVEAAVTDRGTDRRTVNR